MYFENEKEINLWSGVPPLMRENDTENLPTIKPYFPQAWKYNHKALIIYPGGGYGHLAQHEGEGYARFFSNAGYLCFVVSYRLGLQQYYHPAELSDAAKAVRLVRSHAKELNLDPNKIGVIGSSAGGHLAATVSNIHHLGLKEEGEDPTISSRPDCAILCYPVISFVSEYSHLGSAHNLFGIAGDLPKELCEELSCELLVNENTSPTFIWHTVEDMCVPVENSFLYASQLRKHNVNFELHLYEKGNHGIGLANGHPWAEEALRWMGNI